MALKTANDGSNGSFNESDAGMNWLKTFLKALLIAVTALQITACSRTVQWDEEVKLNDGRIIVVTQKKRCEGGDYTANKGATCIAREAWLTIKLPEFSDKEIVWHENLDPMIVNLHLGRLYVVGRPPHTLEFRTYGATNPPYFGFVWDGGIWKRIAFPEIPLEIYDTNMLIESIPSTKTALMTLIVKSSDQENGAMTKDASLRRIDPKHTTSAY
jgi:hypothetical protein